MEATGSTGGHFDLPNDENEYGEKKSTHLELQELYGGELVDVSSSYYFTATMSYQLLRICFKFEWMLDTQTFN